ncbi:ankyrin repeat-containing protein P16F5.05c-like [Corylus avellana]|uniref:ankyrin repeat-containing protein P16F5.05c-like n=1 Tax=Corylus avellana TaxID=13451 RepID=UPI001E209553|nr:ankyrin repeat-containing protein P16F5.05c-like [Corylus avellana]
MRRPQRAYSSGQDNDQVLDEPVPDDHVVTVDEHHDASAKRLHYLDTSVRLYQAALKGDWQVAKILIEKYPDLVRRPITEQKDTALHIAVAAKHATFAKELVKCMTSEDIELRNENGNTALCFAAYAGGSELVSIVQEMVQENKKLPLVRGSCGNTPLYIAALNGSKEMVSYLYPLTPFEDLAPIDRIDILVATISTDMYGYS